MHIAVATHITNGISYIYWPVAHMDTYIQPYHLYIQQSHINDEPVHITPDLIIMLSTYDMDSIGRRYWWCCLPSMLSNITLVSEAEGKQSHTRQIYHWKSKKSHIRLTHRNTKIRQIHRLQSDISSKNRMM